MKHLLGFVFAIAAATAASAEPNLSKAGHRAEAERHATRAEQSAAKARKHEANVERLSKPGYNAMQYKWPAMARGPEHLERQRAVAARKAEAEAREKVAHHTNLANQSVEAEP